MTASDWACLQGKRVLVVEDEFMIAMLYEDLLMQYGCIPVGPASSVQRALDLIRTQTIEAALLDGNLNGRLASPVAQMLEQRGVPFLLLTGYEHLIRTDPILDRARRLVKPVDPGKLVQAMVDAFC